MSALMKTNTRQKSCVECVRSKRKCDQRLPKCQRCVARRVDCRYVAKSPNRTYGNAGGQAAELAAEAATPSSLQLQRSPSPVRGLTPFLTDPFMGLANDPFNLPSLPLDDFLSPAVVSDIMADHDVDSPEAVVGAHYQQRVEYVAQRIARMPKTFAKTAHAPFIYRRLLQARDPPPPLLQDALSACALYCLKNPHNQALVFRNFEAKACQLIAAAADPLRLSRPDLLVTLQALLLYQIVRLFDGDVRLRAQAEADEATLLAWTGVLRARMCHFGPSGPALPPAPSTATATPSREQIRPPDWLHWLLEESIRRTVFVAVMLRGLYAYLKFGYDELSVDGLGITAQAALWDAQSEFGWRTAYCERDRLEMRLAHWDIDLAAARSDDVEELGVLMMAA